MRWMMLNRRRAVDSDRYRVLDEQFQLAVSRLAAGTVERFTFVEYYRNVRSLVSIGYTLHYSERNVQRIKRHALEKIVDE